MFNKLPSYFRFIILFMLFYWGTFVMIGLAAPGGMHFSFIEKYFNYVSWLRMSLLHGSKFFLSLFGHYAHLEPDFTLRLNGGKHIIIAFDCAGYGVLSFWLAYILSAPIPNVSQRIYWLIIGGFLLWFVNCLRISLYLLSRNGIAGIPFKMEHHLFYNIVSYLFIGLLIFSHEYFLRKSLNESNK
jgi:exosortase/archaeosortase family protein